MVRIDRIVMTAALGLAMSIPAMAQKAPKVQALTVDGIHVIASPSDKELITVIIGFEGGFADGTTTNPALAEFASDVVTSSGSKSFPKEAYRKFLSQTSTTITGSGDYRGITYTMTTTRRNFDRAWGVLASLILEPAIDEVEFRNIMQRRVGEIKRRWANPESHASIIADSLVKLGHPVLGRFVEQKDIEGVTATMIPEYMRRIGERSRMLVVAVGNIPPADLKKKLAIFSSLPAGSHKPIVIAPVQPASKPAVEVSDRPSPTTYVQSSFVGPRSGEADFWPLQVGLFHLRNILFEELRTKRNLTYAPGSSLGTTLGQGRGTLSVSSVFPDSSIVVMYHELAKMKRGDIDPAELNNSKQVFATVYYLRQITNEGLANAIYGAQRNSGNWRNAFSLDAIMKVNKEGVQRAFRKYARNLQVGVVGRKGLVTEQKYLFRE